MVGELGPLKLLEMETLTKDYLGGLLIAIIIVLAFFWLRSVTQ